MGNGTNTGNAGNGFDVVQGDATAVLRTLPARSFQCVVTSPPYWGTRDYGTEGQVGLEPTLEAYLARLVGAFAEVRRVLRNDGVLWLVVGDCYTSGGRRYRAPDPKCPDRGMRQRPATPQGLKGKELVGVPWRLAFALQADGWYLRTDVVCHKPNAMPESVRDRPHRAHEYVFMFSKCRRYRYDREAVREPARDRRTVWTACPRTDRNPHPASFPVRLVEPCILSSSRPGDLVLDPFFGSGTVGVACALHGRRCLGIEISPEYAERARQRVRDAWSRAA